MWCSPKCLYRCGALVNSMPEWWYRDFGIAFATRFLFDPIYRARTSGRMEPHLYEVLGPFGFGDAHSEAVSLRPDWIDATITRKHAKRTLQDFGDADRLTVSFAGEEADAPFEKAGAALSYLRIQVTRRNVCTVHGGKGFPACPHCRQAGKSLPPSEGIRDWQQHCANILGASSGGHYDDC